MSADLARRLEDRGIRLKKHHNGQYRASCPQCDRGPNDGALAVRIDGDGCTWCCHRCGLKGGIAADRNGSGRRRSLVERPDLREPEQHRALASWAREFWAGCDLIAPSTVAARYLVDYRGCMLPPFPAETHLRWHPNVKHASGWCGPALVALVSDAETAEPLTIHRTWMQPGGSGKAPTQNPRLLLKGHASRGVVRLWPDHEVTLGLALAEGIETALCAARAGLTPIWATISAGNLGKFPVLPALEGLTIVVDHDWPDKQGRRAGIAAALALDNRYAAAGFDPERDILVIRPDREGLDCADLVTGRRRG